jgi:hypothetical protein
MTHECLQFAQPHADYPIVFHSPSILRRDRALRAATRSWAKETLIYR